MAKAAIDMLAGGLMQTTAYMFGTDHPTGQGALASFGIGAATAGVFLGAGFAFGKLKMALGFTGSAETAISRAAGPTVEQPVRNVFGDALEGLETAPNKEQYIKELEKAAEWARRNPRQAKQNSQGT